MFCLLLKAVINNYTYLTFKRVFCFVDLLFKLKSFKIIEVKRLLTIYYKKLTVLAFISFVMLYDRQVVDSYKSKKKPGFNFHYNIYQISAKITC